MEWPGSLSCCACEKLTINNSPHEIKTALRHKQPTSFLTSPPIRQEGKATRGVILAPLFALAHLTSFWTENF